MKKCTECKREQEIENFSKGYATLDNRLSFCKECENRRRLKRKGIKSELPLTKKCFYCHEIKESFKFTRRSKVGDGLSPYCKTCWESVKELTPNERRSLRTALDEDYLKHLRHTTRTNPNYLHNTLFDKAKARAKKKNLEFTIDKSDYVIPEFCPILGVRIIQGTKGNYDNTPSIDRIDNSKGYVKGNVQIISNKANTMKNSATQEELIMFAKWIQLTFKI